MIVQRPAYIPPEAPEDLLVQYPWDDWQGPPTSGYDSEWVIDSLQAASARAHVVAAIGIYEWIIWRFRALEQDIIPLQIAEACWCASIDNRYLPYVELPIAAWSGPVRRPLWCAEAWLTPLASASEGGWEEWVSSLTFLPMLAMHVLPHPQSFEGWLKAIIERLVLYHPRVEDDGFSDLFGEYESVRRGTLISSDILNPGVPYDPATAPTALMQWLSTVDYAANPFLRSPDELIQEGFEGVPYTLPSA